MLPASLMMRIAIACTRSCERIPSAPMKLTNLPKTSLMACRITAGDLTRNKYRIRERALSSGVMRKMVGHGAAFPSTRQRHVGAAESGVIARVEFKKSRPPFTSPL